MRAVARRYTITLFAVLASATGCSDASVTGDPPPRPIVLSANVDGIALNSGTASARLTGAGNFVIAAPASGAGPALTLRLFSVSKPGTYRLGVTPSLIGGAGEVVLSGALFTTPATGSAGTVTITAVSLTRITGTFSFMASRQTFDFVDTRGVSNGQFDVAVEGTGTLDVPANIGSEVTGTVRGDEFFATEVSVTESPSSGKLRAQLRQSTRLLALDVSEFGGVGTYALGSGAARTLRLDAPVNDFNSTWGGTNAAVSGAITVTSITAARIQGLIDATLTPTFAPLRTPPAAVSLRFDIGLP
jgi:hypothetical protein